MKIEQEPQFFLDLKSLKMEHADEKFFLATTMFSMIVMFFLFDLLY